MKKLLSAFLCMAIFLSLFSMFTAASAAEASGLSAFTDKNEYTDGMFTDVASSSWYASGIKTAYTKGLMLGVSETEFSPERHMPWSQAITLASRLHAAYRGKDIPKTEGLWYMQYVEYARTNKLLPATCPDDDAIDSTNITREGMAVLFRSVIDKKDLPGINDQTIPDLNTVRAEYRDYVSDMYASGIFTGKDGGAFVPNGTATRAEVATLVSRLLCPGLRVSYDSAVNPYMADQMGNLFNGGIAVRKGDTVYYYHSGQANQDTELNTITARKDNGETKIVYTSNVRMDHLSIGPDGQLYFLQDKTLRRLNTETLEDSVVFTSKSSRLSPIETYQFYDGQLYIFEEYIGGDYPDNWRYRIARVSNGIATAVIDNLKFKNITYVDNSLYFFNDSVYYTFTADLTTQLHKYDLKTGQDNIVINYVTRGDIAYQGSTVWFTDYYDSSAKQLLLKRISLELPEVVETVSTLPSSCANGFVSLYANGQKLYIQTTASSEVLSISQSGETTIASVGPGEYTAFTGQAIVHYISDSLSIFNHQNIKVVLPDGSSTGYAEFLGRPYFLFGENQLEATDNQGFWEVTDAPDGKVFIDPMRVYVTPDGDTAVEVIIRNNLDREIGPYQIEAKYKHSSEFEWMFSLPSTFKVSAGSSQILTIVYPAETLTTTSTENISMDMIVYYK